MQIYIKFLNYLRTYYFYCRDAIYRVRFQTFLTILTEFPVFLHFQIWRNMAKKKTKKSAGSGGPLKRLLIMLGKVLLALLILSILLPMAYRWFNPPVTPLMIIRKVKNDLPIDDN